MKEKSGSGTFHRNENQSKKMGKIEVYMFKLKSITISFVLLIVLACFLTTNVYAGTYTTKSGYLAAATKGLLSRAIDFIVAGDRIALNRFLNSNSNIFFLKSGLRVYVEDTSWTGGVVRIRPVGSMTSVWTVVEAIE